MKKVQITETVLRDANQSLMATRLPYSDFADILPEMNKAGYYSVECWGGATFDSCLRYLGEDPWQRLRDIRKAMPDTKLQMLLRGQNLLGYKHYHDDVVEKFVELSIKNGIDILRIFDALNDFRNIATALEATKKYATKNTVASGCISYTQSPVHTVEKYVEMCKELKNMGFDTICLKDISTIEILPQILEAGVTSLKIEGRMKQPGYTAGVTSVYRKYLDLLFEKGAENYRVAEEDKRYLLDLFNRGGSCTGYYQMQNGPSMMAFSNEKKTGDVSPVLRKKKEKIQGTFILFPGSPAILDVSCRGIHGFASVGEVQYAQNQPLTEERIRSQMEKLGNTEYEWENLEIQMDENIFIPMKMLNEARREALESLENELLKPYKREENNGKKRLSEDAGRKADSPKQKNLPIYISCEEKSTALALYKREGIHGMYLNADAMEVCLDDCVSRGMEMYLSLPHIMRGEMPRELLTRIREWMDRGMTGFLVRNLETFAVLRKAGLAEKCVLDHSMYTWNDEAADFWKDQKVLRNTVPLELNEGEIRHRDNRDSEMLIYGYLPLMISAQCVHKNLYGCNHKEEGVTLKDRYDKEFTAKCICNPWKTENTDFCIPCYNIIYNSIPYGLLKEKSQIDRLGVSSLRLAFTIEKPQDAVKIYEEFRAVYRDGKNPPKREYTKGHFKRGAE